MADAHAEVRAAHDAFYQAFASGDIEALLRLLLPSEALAVAHPGWPPARGLDEVTRSWREVLRAPPPIHTDAVDVRLVGTDVAVVSCLEIISNRAMAAINVWIADEHGWRLVSHQAAEAPTVQPILGALDEDTVH